MKRARNFSSRRANPPAAGAARGNTNPEPQRARASRSASRPQGLSLPGCADFRRTSARGEARRGPLRTQRRARAREGGGGRASTRARGGGGGGRSSGLRLLLAGALHGPLHIMTGGYWGQRTIFANYSAAIARGRRAQRTQPRRRARPFALAPGRRALPTETCGDATPSGGVPVLVPRGGRGARPVERPSSRACSAARGARARDVPPSNGLGADDLLRL